MDYPYIDWGGPDTIEQILSDFEEKPEVLHGAELLYASYSQDGYDGSAVVVLRRDGELRLVSGGHCSCHGLEDQWSEEPVTVEALKMFKYKDHARWDEFVESLS